MKVLDKKTLWKGRFLRAVLVQYSDPRTGGTRDWEAVERVNCDGVVAIVPFTPDGSVILIRQFRPPINSHVIELPAGLCDPGESLEDAARRELREETGYAAGKLFFLTRGPLSSGMSSEMLDVFVATDLSFAGIGKRDETEDIEIMKIPLDRLIPELDRLAKAGNVIDLKAFGLVELAKNSLKDANS